jgi:hypothetical protein
MSTETRGELSRSSRMSGLALVAPTPRAAEVPTPGATRGRMQTAYVG